MHTQDLDALPASTLLGPDEAAAALGLKRKTLDTWRSTGRYGLKFIKCGRLVKYRAADLREFLESRTREHTGG